MDTNIPEFKKLKFPETLKFVFDFDYVIVEKEIRIYFLKNTRNGNGFEFYVTKYMSLPMPQTNEDCYLSKGFKAECLFFGTAYHDGIRHLYMGDNATDSGCYLYYPKSLEISNIFKKLRELEEKFCHHL